MRTAYPVWTSEKKILQSENSPDFYVNDASNRRYESLSGNLANYANGLGVVQDASLKNSHYSEANRKPQSILKSNIHNSTENPDTFIKPTEMPSNQNHSHTSVLHNLLLNSNENQIPPSNETEKFKKNEFIGQLVSAVTGRGSSENKYSYQDQDRQQLENQTLRQNNLKNDDTLIKEYERELKRQDTHLIDYSLTSSINYMNQLHSTDNQQNNFQKLTENGDNQSNDKNSFTINQKNDYEK